MISLNGIKISGAEDPDFGGQEANSTIFPKISHMFDILLALTDLHNFVSFVQILVLN